MELYIEKEFLDDFFIDYNDNNLIQKTVKQIFEDYGDKSIFINAMENSFEDFEKLKEENPFFASICNNNMSPNFVEISWGLIKESNFNQTLIFTNKTYDWFKDAEEKGALCFSYDSYETDIGNIIKNLHFKIDLSEGFKGWGFLDKMNQINYNYLTITDGYILKDEKKMRYNIFQILNKLTLSHNIYLDILTKELKPDHPKDGEKRKAKAKERYNAINDKYNSKIKNIRIIMSEGLINEEGFNFHDRIIQTNFSLMDCGKGFDDLKINKISNSQIISETIFDKYTYDRLRRHKSYQTKYINGLIDSKAGKNFKMFPLIDS